MTQTRSHSYLPTTVLDISHCFHSFSGDGASTSRRGGARHRWCLSFHRPFITGFNTSWPKRGFSTPRPPDLRWHHVTKTWNKFLICCMSAQRNYHLSSANTQNVEYVNDILFVGMEDGQPTDSHPSDIETIIDFLRRPHEVLKTLSTSPCTTLIVPFDHVLENCLSITNDAWINNTSNVCLITCHQKSFDHPFQKIHTRTAAYLPCGWSTAHAVPIPLKTETAPRGECAQPKDIALFALDKWIKPPISPDGLYWDRTTKQHRDFILHYMTAHTTTLASASTSDTTELIADVLLLKVKDGHVIDIENNDMIDIEHLVRQTV